MGYRVRHLGFRAEGMAGVWFRLRIEGFRA